MIKTILTLAAAVVASAFLTATDANAQALYWVDAPADTSSCHDTPDLGRVCIAIPARRAVQDTPTGRLVAALTLVDIDNKAFVHTSMMADCGNPRTPVQAITVLINADGTRTLDKPVNMDGPGADRIISARVRAVLCGQRYTRVTR